MTWWEFYSDFLQRLRAYRSDPTTQPLLFLRLASQTIAEFQRATALLLRSSDFEWDDNLQAFRLGRAVWVVRKCWLGDGTNWTPALPVSPEQAAEIRNRGAVDGLAILETPRHYGRHWREFWASERAPWIVWQEVVETATGTTGVLRTYPERLPSQEYARILYVVNYEPLSESSNQWSWVFGAAVLEDAMRAQQLPQEIIPYTSGLTAAVVWRYLQETGTLPPTEGVHPLLAEYQAAIAQANRDNRYRARELVAPYNLSPYSS